MALISASILRRERFPLRCFILLLVGLALPRAALPNGPTFVCCLAAWVLLVLALLSASRAQPLFQLGAGAALVTAAAQEPPTWLALVTSFLLLVCVSPSAITRGKYWLVLAVGCVAPALFYAAVFAVGEDQRIALRLAFRVQASAFELAALGVALLLLAATTAAFVVEASAPAPFKRWRSVSAGWLALLVFAIFGARLAFIASVATLRTDLMIWSEPPALVNLLKLHNHELFYGPMQWANSYSYSPGLELTQSTLLRPLQLDLSLRAHRALGLVWQLGSAVLLSYGLWPWLGVRLRKALGPFAFLALPVLGASLSTVTLSSLLAPHVHPDHLLLLCFCAATALCLRAEPFQARHWLALAALPIAATAFKLTGAGIGVGLTLAVLFERRWRALGVLAVAGVLALLTIPLFDARLGSFSAYAIRLQASHPMEWSRIVDVPHTAPGSIFLIAALALLASAWARPGRASVRAATRVLLLTVGLASTSLVAYLKHGGRENSLMPLTIGGAALLLVLLGELGQASASDAVPGFAVPSPLLSVVLVWVALASCWPSPPIVGAPRERLIALHERERSFLTQLLAQGKRPWSQGTAAWIDAGRRDTPRDRLSSASELELGHNPALEASEARLLNDYDGLLLSTNALAENEWLRRLRPRLERAYRVIEFPSKGGALSDGGYVILMRREHARHTLPANKSEKPLLP